MIFTSSQKNEGFSLVEMLVAVSLLLMVIVGPMAITAKASKSASFASEQVQAFFLAQEGLELAQMGRDNLLLQNLKGDITNPWGSFIATNGAFKECYSSSGCSLVWDNNNAFAVGACGGASCKMYFHENGGRAKYNYDSSGTPTPFTRKISFTKLTGDKAVKVVSTVTWRTGSIIAEQKVSTETYLYNIYDKP